MSARFHEFEVFNMKTREMQKMVVCIDAIKAALLEKATLHGDSSELKEVVFAELGSTAIHNPLCLVCDHATFRGLTTGESWVE